MHSKAKGTAMPDQKAVFAHRGYFNKASKRFYRENSKAICEAAAQKDYVKVIEIDVRKSSDGVLYCYHGKLLQYYFSLRIPRKFSNIRRRYHVDTLSDVLDVIPEDKVLFLDIKSRSITRSDVLGVLAGRTFKEVVLGHTSLTTAFLDRFYDMPPGVVKAMNGLVLRRFHDIKKLKEKNYKYIAATFPFQVDLDIVRKAEQHGIELMYMGVFSRGAKHYLRVVDKYGIPHVFSDFV